MTFALLEHTTDRPPGVHWDFMIEVAGHEKLATWRLKHDPIGHAGEIEAERIGDHRRAYLDYEGEISGARGRVRRIDRGPAEIERYDGTTLVAELRGEHLRGWYSVIARAGAAACFRRLDL